MMAIGVIGNTMEFDSIILGSSPGSLTINKQIVIATRKGISLSPSAYCRMGKRRREYAWDIFIR